MKDPNPHRKPSSRGIPTWIIVLGAIVIVGFVLWNGGYIHLPGAH